MLDLASGSGIYLADIAAAGLDLQVVQANPGYRFASDRAHRASHKYGAHSVSLLALEPVRASRHTSQPNLGDGTRIVHSAQQGGLDDTTTTQEISK